MNFNFFFHHFLLFCFSRFLLYYKEDFCLLVCSKNDEKEKNGYTTLHHFRTHTQITKLWHLFIIFFFCCCVYFRLFRGKLNSFDFFERERRRKEKKKKVRTKKISKNTLIISQTRKQKLKQLF